MTRQQQRLALSLQSKHSTMILLRLNEEGDKTSEKEGFDGGSNRHDGDGKGHDSDGNEHDG
eukprot:14052972-Ditylum_brightwellii.AAC.1